MLFLITSLMWCIDPSSERTIYIIIMYVYLICRIQIIVFEKYYAKVCINSACSHYRHVLSNETLHVHFTPSINKLIYYY